MEQEEQEPVEQQEPETDRKQEPAVALQKTETAQGGCAIRSGEAAETAYTAHVIYFQMTGSGSRTLSGMSLQAQ